MATTQFGPDGCENTTGVRVNLRNFIAYCEAVISKSAVVESPVGSLRNASRRLLCTVTPPLGEGSNPALSMQICRQSKGGLPCSFASARKSPSPIDEGGARPELNDALAETLVGLVAASEDASIRPSQLGANTEVRHIVGVGREGGLLVIAEPLEAGMQHTFCKAQRGGGEAGSAAQRRGSPSPGASRRRHNGRRVPRAKRRIGGVTPVEC